MKTLTGLTKDELTRYKCEVYSDLFIPFRQRWKEVDRITAQIKELDTPDRKR